MTDQNKKSLKQFWCRDYLWEIFEQMSGQLECSVDYLINESMRQYARSRNYGGAGVPAGLMTNPGQTAAAFDQNIGSSPGNAMSPKKTDMFGSSPGAAAAPSYGNQFAAPPPTNSPFGAPPPMAPPLGGSGSGSPFGGPPNTSAPFGAPPPAAPPLPTSGAMGSSFGTGNQQSAFPPSLGRPDQTMPAPARNPLPPPPASPPSILPPSPFGAGPPGFPPQIPSSAGVMTTPHGSAMGGRNPAPPPLRQTEAFPASEPPPLPGRSSMASGLPSLAVVFNGQKFPVTKEEFIIGRSTKTADLAIKDGNISRQHAAIVWQGDAFYIRDLGSTNGIEFDGRRVDAHRINEGDLILLCDYELHFTYM